MRGGRIFQPDKPSCLVRQFPLRYLSILGPPAYSAVLGNQQNRLSDMVWSTSSPQKGDSYQPASVYFPGFYQVEATETAGQRIYMVGTWGNLWGKPVPNSIELPLAAVQLMCWGLRSDGTWLQFYNATCTSGSQALWVGKVVEHCPYSSVRVMTRAYVGSGQSLRRVTGYILNLQW